MVPEHLRYTPTHGWCRLDGQAVVIGITAQGIAALGNLIYVELPEVGDDVLREVPFGEIEGTRDVKDLTSAFDGIVEEVNGSVVLSPDILLKDPYEEGWLIRLRPGAPAALDSLLSAADYEEHVRKRRGK